MKQIAAFLKATTLGGLFVLLPIVILFGLFGKTAVGLRDTVEAIMVKTAGQDSAEAHFPLVFAVLIVIGISFLLGLLMITRRGQRSGRWIENVLLFKLPGYPAVRAIVGGLADAEREGVIKPGLMTVDDGIQTFVFITEDHGNGWYSVFIPGSPNPGGGNVQIVRADLIQPLGVRITDITLAHQQWGVGAAKVLAKHSHQPSKPNLPLSESSALPS